MYDKLRSLENVNYHVAMSENFIGEKNNYGLRADVELQHRDLSQLYVWCGSNEDNKKQQRIHVLCRDNK